MSEVSIKVIIAGRTYPLTVNGGEEEAIRKAAEDINNNVKFLQDNYAVKDMQDLLAMTALQLATKSSKSAPAVDQDISSIRLKLEEICKDIDQVE